MDSAMSSSPESIFTILGGTTITDRAAIIRDECREGSRVELRRREPGAMRLDVWLECKTLLGLMKGWKRIGHVPDDLAAELLLRSGNGSAVIGRGTVKTVYAPAGRDEAVVIVTVEKE